MHSILLLASLFFSPNQQPGELDGTVPHPTRPLYSGGIPSPADGARNQEAWWVQLNPSWVVAESPLLEDGVRKSLLERVAGIQGVDEAQLQAWLEATTSDAFTMNYRILVDGVEALVGRESVPLGRPVAFSDLVRNTDVLDFDVEIASGTEIFDPIMGRMYSGASLALQVLPVPGKGWSAEFALVYSHRLPGEPVDMDYAQVMGKDRLISRLAEAGAKTLLLPGQSSTLNLPNLGPGQIILEIKVDSPAPGGPLVLMDQLAWVSVPSLARSTHWRQYLRSWEEKYTVWADGQGDLVFAGDDALVAAQAAQKVAQQDLKILHLSFSAQRMLAGIEGERSDLNLEMLEETPFNFAQGTLRDALTGWNVEVAQVARVADPVFTDLFSGWSGSMNGRRRKDGRYEVAVDLRFSLVDVSASKSLRLAAATLSQKTYDGEVPASPAHTMRVETPEVRTAHFRGNYLTDAEGHLVLIRSANSVLGEGGRLRLEFKLSQP